MPHVHGYITLTHAVSCTILRREAPPAGGGAGIYYHGAYLEAVDEL